MEHEDYAGPERRRAITADAVSLMIEESIDDRITKMESRLYAHLDVKIGQIHAAFSKHVDEAFVVPLHKHKEYHEGKVKAAADWAKLKTDLIGWAIKGTLVFVLGLFLLGVKEWMAREMVRPVLATESKK